MLKKTLYSLFLLDNVKTANGYVLGDGTSLAFYDADKVVIPVAEQPPGDSWTLAFNNVGDFNAFEEVEFSSTLTLTPAFFDWMCGAGHCGGLSATEYLERTTNSTQSSCADTEVVYHHETGTYKTIAELKQISNTEYRKYCLFWHVNMHSCPKLLSTGEMAFCTPYIGTSLATHSPAQSHVGRYGAAGSGNENNIVRNAVFRTTVTTVEAAATDYTTIAHYKFGAGDPADSSKGSISLAAGWAHKINAFAERTQCPSGYVPNPDGTCAPCGEGYYGNTPTPTTADVTQTDADTIAQVNDGNWTLTSYSNDRFCVQCPRGTFWPAIGAAGNTNTALSSMATPSCTQCDRGYHAPDLASGSCTACPAGTQQDNVGQDACFPCALGYYQPNSAQENCIAAPDGSYVDTRNAVEATQCPDSSMTTNGEARKSGAECVCPVGKYMLFSGGSDEGNSNAGLTNDQIREKVFGTGLKCIDCPTGFRCLGGRVQSANPNNNDALEFRHVMPRLKTKFMARRSLPFEAYDCRNEKRCPGGNEPSFNYDSTAAPVCGANINPDDQVNCVKCHDDYYLTNQMSECSKCTGFHLILNMLVFIGICCGFFGVYKIANSSLTVEMSPLLSASISLGVTISMLQSLGLISSLALKWSSPLNEIMGLLKIFIFDLESFGTACYTGDSAMFKLLSKQALPLIIVSVYFLAHKVLKADVNKCKNSTGMLLVGLFAAFAIAAFSPFSCYAGPNGLRVLQSSPGVHCDADIDSEYTMLVIVGGLTILAYPVGGMAYLFKTAINAPVLSLRKSFVTAHRFMFFRFRPDRYYWLPILLLRNTLIGFPPILFEEPHAQALLVIAILLFSLCIQMHYWPWRSNDLNFYDSATCMLIVLVLCFWFPTSFSTDVTDETGDVISTANTANTKVYSDGALICLVCLFLCTSTVFIRILKKMKDANSKGESITAKKSKREVQAEQKIISHLNYLYDVVKFSNDKYMIMINEYMETLNSFDLQFCEQAMTLLKLHFCTTVEKKNLVKSMSRSKSFFSNTERITVAGHEDEINEVINAAKTGNTDVLKRKSELSNVEVQQLVSLTEMDQALDAKKANATAEDKEKMKEEYLEAAKLEAGGSRTNTDTEDDAKKE